jgi:hypothetical protein
MYVIIHLFIYLNSENGKPTKKNSNFPLSFVDKKEKEKEIREDSILFQKARERSRSNLK